MANKSIKEPANELTPTSSELIGRKVLIIVENLPVPFDRRVWQEARALRDAGAQICIICPMMGEHTKSYEHLEDIHIYRHPLPVEAKRAMAYFVEYGLAIFWQTVLAWKILFKHGFDTIHGCNPPDLVFLIAWQFKLLGKRYIFDHHDINPEFFESKFERRGVFWRLLKLFEWLNFKSAKVVISTNKSYRKIAIERGGKNPDSVFVVRSGPDLSRVKKVPENNELRNGHKFLIGYVGVMSESEGIDLLLESIRLLVIERARTDIQFTLVGGGTNLEHLSNLSVEMGLENYVTFTGRAPDHLLFEVLSTADVCVNPDRVNEMNDKSTMNKILEYMAMSKPIVQYDVTEGRYSAEGSSLYAKPNDVVDFADKIEQLLDDPAARKKMGEIGRKRIEKELAWSHEVPNLISAYQASAK